MARSLTRFVPTVAMFTVLVPLMTAQAQATPNAQRIPDLAGFRKHLPAHPGWMRSESGSGRLYVASGPAGSGGGFVAVYDLESLSMIGEITDGADSPTGVAVDARGNLYIGNASGAINEYFFGGTSPTRMLMLPSSLEATDVVTDASLQLFVSDSGGGVFHFGHVGTTPKSRLTNPALSTAYGVAVDKRGDVFALGPSTIVEYEHGREPGVILGLGSLVGPNSLVFDKSGNFIVDDPGASVVSVYAPSQTEPSQSVGVEQGAGHIAIDESKRFLYLPAQNNIYVYDYPGFTLQSSAAVPGATVGLSGAAVSGSATAGECKPHLGGDRIYNGSAKTPSGGHSFVFEESPTVYGSKAALCTISYSGLEEVTGLTVDPSDHLWAASYDSRSNVESLLAFDVHVSGSANPIQIISGGNTGLPQPPQYLGIASDRRGRIWVPHWAQGCGGYLTAFANDANGNVPPVTSIGAHDDGQSEGIYAPTDVAFDRHGNMYVSNFCTPGSDNASVSVFKPPFFDTEKPVATWVLPGNSQYAEGDYITVDSHDNVWVGGQFNLDKFPHGLRSNGIVSVQIDGSAARADAHTRFNGSWEVNGIATDSRDRLFVANPESEEVDILPADATTYAPTHIITSPSWPYAAALSLTIGP